MRKSISRYIDRCPNKCSHCTIQKHVLEIPFGKFFSKGSESHQRELRIETQVDRHFKDPPDHTLVKCAPITFGKKLFLLLVMKSLGDLADRFEQESLGHSSKREEELTRGKMSFGLKLLDLSDQNRLHSIHRLGHHRHKVLRGFQNIFLKILLGGLDAGIKRLKAFLDLCNFLWCDRTAPELRY